MPIDKSKYPTNWKAISQRIRERAGNKCEQCGLPNYAWIVRSRVNPERYMLYDYRDDRFYLHDGTPIRGSEISTEFDGNRTTVILTVHHNDFDTTNNADENLIALCQLHHLRADAKNHAKHAAETRRLNYERESGQLSLFARAESEG